MGRKPVSVQRAQVEHRRAALREPFGRDLLTKKFGDAGAALVLEAFGMYRSGKHKGEPRGFIYWDKITVGGWRRDNGVGHVERPGSRNFAAGLTFDRPSNGGMPSRGGVAAMGDAEWLLTLSRGLGGMTKRWNYTTDEPARDSDFPKAWDAIRAAADAERHVRIEQTRRELLAEQPL
jgi:hypothetical protein